MTTRYIDDAYTFYAVSTRFDTGVATDADAVLPYRVYEEETTTPLLTGNMALLDSANTAGFYSEQITLSAANGFEVGKCYCVHIGGTVNSVVGAATREFVVRKKPLSPTTEGRELDVSAGGEAGVDWANVGSPTTTVGLSGTTVATVTTTTTATNLTNLPTIPANWLTAAGTAADFTTEIQSGLATTIHVQEVEDKLDIVDTVVDAILVDTGTTLDGRIPAALVGGRMDANVGAISGSTDSADNLEESTEAIGYGTVGVGGTTTVFVTTALTPDSAVNDQFVGRVLIFKNDTTTAELRGQATTISDWAHVSAEIGTFTVVALTTAPANGDTFTIL